MQSKAIAIESAANDLVILWNKLPRWQLPELQRILIMTVTDSGAGLLMESLQYPVHLNARW